MRAWPSTLVRWPQPATHCSGNKPTGDQCRRGHKRGPLTALTAALALRVCPLTLLWSRIGRQRCAVRAAFAVALLLFWQCWAKPAPAWWPGNGWCWGWPCSARSKVRPWCCGLKLLLGFGWTGGPGGHCGDGWARARLASACWGPCVPALVKRPPARCGRASRFDSFLRYHQPAALQSRSSTTTCKPVVISAGDGGGHAPHPPARLPSPPLPWSGPGPGP